MEQVKAFIEKATRDEQLAAKLEELTKQNAEVGEIIALAAEYGFTFTAEDLEAAKRNAGESRELSEEELDNVAGGATYNYYDEDTCKGLTERKNGVCNGFLSVNILPCDHYRWEGIGYLHGSGYLQKFSCAQNGFPPYIGAGNGTYDPDKQHLLY